MTGRGPQVTTRRDLRRPGHYFFVDANDVREHGSNQTLRASIFFKGTADLVQKGGRREILAGAAQRRQDYRQERFDSSAGEVGPRGLNRTRRAGPAAALKRRRR